MVPSAVFLVHLLQDVHALRPLIFMAAKDFGFHTQLLVSDRFRARDTSGVWLKEIEIICAESGAVAQFFADDWQARSYLTGQGLLFAASESHIHNHGVAHNIFRHAPATYLKVTLQHGFECVGFRHGADHTRFYGDTASFAADILCGWSGPEHLSALAPSQAPKLVVTGPTSVLHMARGGVSEGPIQGLVCENLHSVRFESADKLEQEFLQTFRKFAGALHRHGHGVRLRPHPGGQYSAKTDAVLPRNVQLENAPLYRLDLRQFSYGISPPSSVLIDMLLADIPTAVWRDRRGRIDARNYEGLPTVSSADDLINFAYEAVRDRERLVSSQRRWLDQQGMPREPAEVYSRFARLFETAQRMEVRPPGSRAERERILLVHSENVGLQPQMQQALAALTANGEVASRAIATDGSMIAGHPSQEEDSTDGTAAATLDANDPSVIFLFEQDVSAYQPILEWARFRRVPVIYFLNFPAPDAAAPPQAEAGFEDVAGRSGLLHEVDVIYAPTEDQIARLKRTFPELETIAGPGKPGVPDQRQAASELRKDLLRIIALGHAMAESRASLAQKEVRVCHSQ